MPTYEYACTSCGHRLEAVQSFSDDSLTECPACGRELRKVYAPVGIVLKGSGFYKTDSRAATGNGSGAKKSDDSANGSSSSDATTKKDAPASGGGTEAKPAASAAT